MSPADIVSKLWNYCNVLRDDGMSYGDYPGSCPGQADNEAAPAHPCACGIRTSCSAQLTYLLFIKMADERTKAPYLLARGAQASNQKSPVPEKYSWPPSPQPRSAPRPFACTRMALRQRKAVLCETLPRPRGRGGILTMATSCSITTANSRALRFYE
jgi:hypothetical protein